MSDDHYNAVLDFKDESLYALIQGYARVGQGGGNSDVLDIKTNNPVANSYSE